MVLDKKSKVRLIIAPYMDHATRKRSFAKTMTWRILATTDTVIIARLITGSWEAGIAIGGIEIVTKVFLYYLHERGWANLEWGIVRESIVSS